MERSLAQITQVRAAAQPRAVAFVCGASSLTYGALHHQAAAVAARLVSHGVERGARVGYLGRNHLGYPVVAGATSRLRAVSVGLNWRLSPEELAVVLDDAAPRVVFVDREFVHSATEALSVVARSRASKSDVELPTVVEIDSDPRPLLDWAGPSTEGVGDHLTDADVSDIASIIYTSGTTGRPKGVVTANAGLIEHLRTPTPWTVDAASTVLLVSPMFHAVGVVWTAFVIDTGSTGVLIADPDPSGVLAEVERRRVTHTVWVPALLQVLLDHPDRPTRDLSSLQVVIYGASPISEQLLEQAFACLPGCRFVQGYGMTETTGPVTYLSADEHIPGSPRLRTAGRAAANCDVRVVDLHSGRPAEVGSPGEVQARSTQFATGYWHNPTETAALFTSDNWLRTGDIGTLDSDGYLTLTDRVKDVIVSGGENVYSGEVERVLLLMPGIAEACVIGRPSDRWGEEVTAVIVARRVATDDRDEGAGLAETVIDEAAVIAFCREHLAHYKCPTSVHFAETLPRNPAGKVLRRLVRSPFWPD